MMSNNLQILNKIFYTKLRLCESHLLSKTEFVNNNIVYIYIKGRALIQ